MNIYFLLTFVFSYLLLKYKFAHKFTIQKQYEYNNFADCKCMCNIKNYYNVLSNLMFVIGGLYNIFDDFILCLCSILVCIGSAYYHLNPNIDTLFYDRLPMQISFTYLILSKITLNIYEQIFIVLYSFYVLIKWKFTLDLIPYASFQTALIIYWLLFDKQMLLSIICYILAKICEDLDYEIYYLTHNSISGHTLKHIFAGYALFFIDF